MYTSSIHIIIIITSSVHIIIMYSFRPKLLECFDWNTNIKESMRNLWKTPN
jgi:hypothetical protein